MVNILICIVVGMMIIITLLTMLYVKEKHNNENELTRIIFDSDKLFLIFKNNNMISLNYGNTIYDLKAYNRVFSEDEINEIFSEQRTDITIK